MSPKGKSKIPGIVRKHESDLLKEWTSEQTASSTLRLDLLPEAEMREQSREFLRLLREALDRASSDDMDDIQTPEFDAVREMLSSLSRTRSQQGFSPAETATFLFSLKQPLFTLLQSELGGDAEALATEMWNATRLVDSLGLYTMETFQAAREQVIQSQQEEMLELSTPVVKLWDGILALPMIGTLDSSRTQVVMENLLQKIVDTGSTIAILDITGVPTVDTLVAQHLLKTVTAARLMGAECIISGIRPQIAQTIVHLGVDLGDVTTKATMADAFALALKRCGLTISSARS